MRSTFLSVLLLFFSVVAFAQMPEMSEEHRQALKELDFMAGKWAGSGWMFIQGGKRVTFEQTEDIQWKAGKAALAIEGKGHSEGKVIHDAFAVITYDPQRKAYDFNSVLASGMGGKFAARISAENTFEWTMEVPGRTITYIITLNDKGQWYEKGMVKMGEGQAFQFFEMTLEKVE